MFVAHTSIPLRQADIDISGAIIKNIIKTINNKEINIVDFFNFIMFYLTTKK